MAGLTMRYTQLYKYVNLHTRQAELLFVYTSVQKNRLDGIKASISRRYEINP